jgi:ergothioneine biosynthesis protein EgtC
MCRLLGYLGQPIQLDQLISQPEHSLIIQSYQPLEMTAGLMNADGFGIGWYDRSIEPPFIYKSTIPIWNDINLPHLNRYIKSSCFLANVRSATPGQPLDLSNCQPFSYGQILGIHNGFIQNFKRSLYRPLRQQLDDKFYQGIGGTTDSEHILALFFHNLEKSSNMTDAMARTLNQVMNLAKVYDVNASLNLVITDGEQLVAARCATRSPIPTLYYLADSHSVIVASEPLSSDSSEWISLSENSILAIAPDLTCRTYNLQET